MLTKTEWQQPGRILLNEFVGEISLADMEQSWHDAVALIDADEGTLPIHFIMDFSRRTQYAPELFQLQTMRQLFENSSNHPRLSWFIVVQAAPHPVMLFTSTMAARLSNRKLRIVASLEEALRYLRYTDSSLLQKPKTPSE